MYTNKHVYQFHSVQNHTRVIKAMIEKKHSKARRHILTSIDKCVCLCFTYYAKKKSNNNLSAECVLVFMLKSSIPDILALSLVYHLNGPLSHLNGCDMKKKLYVPKKNHNNTIN